jgi:hypothetical protein
MVVAKKEAVKTGMYVAVIVTVYVEIEMAKDVTMEVAVESSGRNGYVYCYDSGRGSSLRNGYGCCYVSGSGSSGINGFGCCYNSENGRLD